MTAVWWQEKMFVMQAALLRCDIFLNIWSKQIQIQSWLLQRLCFMQLWGYDGWSSSFKDRLVMNRWWVSARKLELILWTFIFDCIVNFHEVLWTLCLCSHVYIDESAMHRFMKCQRQLFSYHQKMNVNRQLICNIIKYPMMWPECSGSTILNLMLTRNKHKISLECFCCGLRCKPWVGDLCLTLKLLKPSNQTSMTILKVLAVVVCNVLQVWLTEVRMSLDTQFLIPGPLGTAVSWRSPPVRLTRACAHLGRECQSRRGVLRLEKWAANGLPKISRRRSGVDGPFVKSRKQFPANVLTSG